MDIFTQAINVAIVAEMQKPQEIPAAFCLNNTTSLKTFAHRSERS
jgi:hypothetical protein